MLPRLLSLSIVLMVTVGCESATLEVALNGGRLEIRASTISSSQLPASFDPSRTFHYRFGRVEDPRALLVSLWDAGLRSSRAWQPLDDRCYDPVGPQFTVELLDDDSRILEHGFARSDGRLHCATRLIRYTVSQHGG